MNKNSQKLLVCFYARPQYSKKTAKGKITYIRTYCTDDPLTIIDRPMQPGDIKRFHSQWKKYKAFK